MTNPGISLLPKPLPSDQLFLGQFLSQPLHPEIDSFASASTSEIDELSDFFIHARYKDLFSLDAEGRFAQSYGARFDLGRVWRQRSLLSVTAEQVISRTLESAREAFELVCNDPETREWLFERAQNGAQTLYFVVGIKELKNAKFKRAKLGDGGLSGKLLETALENDARVPRSVKSKVATAANSTAETCLSGVFGLDIRKVKARINHPQEPHALDDLGYMWTYYPVPGDSGSPKQLMIGLGDAVPAEELRYMLNPSEEEVAINLEAISAMSEHALSTTHSPMLRADSPHLRGRSPSPLPPSLRV